MKKNIILAAFMLTLNILNAQDNAKVRASVSEQFKNLFANAKNVQWTNLGKEITQAQFSYNGGSWVAYFDQAGDLITSGRRIKKVEDLPLKVQSGFQRAKGQMEKKGQTSELVIIYEMINGDETSYFVTMRNDGSISTYSIALNGDTSLKLKRPRAHEPVAPVDAIAKKN